MLPNLVKQHKIQSDAGAYSWPQTPTQFEQRPTSTTPWTRLIGASVVTLLGATTTLGDEIWRSDDLSTAFTQTSSIHDRSPAARNIDLGSKLGKRIDELYINVFKYTARAVSVDHSKNIATFVTDIDGKTKYFEWKLENIPFHVAESAEVVFHGYKTARGEEKVRFLRVRQVGADAETKELIASLTYVKNSHP